MEQDLLSEEGVATDVLWSNL